MPWFDNLNTRINEYKSSITTKVTKGAEKIINEITILSEGDLFSSDELNRISTCEMLDRLLTEKTSTYSSYSQQTIVRMLENILIQVDATTRHRIRFIENVPISPDTKEMKQRSLTLKQMILRGKWVSEISLSICHLGIVLEQRDKARGSKEAEEPKAEEPKAEAPKVEAPKVEETLIQNANIRIIPTPCNYSLLEIFDIWKKVLSHLLQGGEKASSDIIDFMFHYRSILEMTFQGNYVNSDKSINIRKMEPSPHISSSSSSDITFPLFHSLQSTFCELIECSKVDWKDDFLHEKVTGILNRLKTIGSDAPMSSDNLRESVHNYSLLTLIVRAVSSRRLEYKEDIINRLDYLSVKMNAITVSIKEECSLTENDVSIQMNSLIKNINEDTEIIDRSIIDESQNGITKEDEATDIQNLIVQKGTEISELKSLLQEKECELQVLSAKLKALLFLGEQEKEIRDIENNKEMEMKKFRQRHIQFLKAQEELLTRALLTGSNTHRSVGDLTVNSEKREEALTQRARNYANEYLRICRRMIEDDNVAVQQLLSVPITSIAKDSILSHLKCFMNRKSEIHDTFSKYEKVLCTMNPIDGEMVTFSNKEEYNKIISICDTVIGEIQMVIGQQKETGKLGDISVTHDKSRKDDDSENENNNNK